MKVLVYFKQEFYSTEVVKFCSIEYTAKVFDVESKDHLLNVFQNYEYVPKYIRDHIEYVTCGKKTMLWYLPETFKPHF